MKNALYDIALENTDRYGTLARHAEAADDQELAEFFCQVRIQNLRQAQQAKRLLAQRVAE